MKTAGDTCLDTLLAIDPGREKCGVAVGRPGQVMARAVIPRDALAAEVLALSRRFRVARILVGRGTGSSSVLEDLARTGGLPAATVVDEAGTTLEARRRYFQDHPRRGWRRWIPVSLQTPPEPYDDYVAALLLERLPAQTSGRVGGAADGRG